MTRLTAPVTPLTVLAGVGPKTIEKIEAAGISNLEQLAAMTPEQLLEAILKSTMAKPLA